MVEIILQKLHKLKLCYSTLSRLICSSIKQRLLLPFKILAVFALVVFYDIFLLLLYFTMLLYVLHDDVVVFHVAVVILVVVLRAVVVVFAIVVLQVVVFAILSHEKRFLFTTDVYA